MCPLKDKKKLILVFVFIRFNCRHSTNDSMVKNNQTYYAILPLIDSRIR